MTRKNILKYERELRGWSQARVAEKVGTTPSTVSVWERGHASPSAYFREQLCLLFGKNAYELGLLDGTNGSTPGEETPLPESGIYDPMIPLPLSTSLVGREADIEQMKSQLIGGERVAVMALHGLPGVGKTALAIALTHDPAIRAEFHSGVLWAGLGPHPSIISILGHWGMLLGMTAPDMALLDDKKAWAAALRRRIGTRHMLLVIDDVWNVDDGLDLVVGGTSCTHIITTRFPSIALRIAGSRARVVRELDVANSVQLLSSFVPDTSLNEPEQFSSLAYSVGGLPLALILVGKYLWMEAYTGQPRRLQKAIEHLQSTETRFHLTQAQPQLERPPNLQSTTPWSLFSTIAVSDQHISEQGRATLRALSVFPAKPNSFSEEVALAVSGMPAEVLDHLVDAGLLENGSAGRYSLHQTISDYVHVQMTDVALADAYRRMVEYIVHYVEMHKADYALLEQESPLILRALDVAFERMMYREFIRGTLAFAQFLRVWGLYALAETYLHRAYTTALAQEDTVHTIQVLSSLGQILVQQEKYVQAETSLREGLALASQLQHTEYSGDLLLSLGRLSWEQEKYVQAETYLREGLALAYQHNDRARLCVLLSSFGTMMGQKGDYVRAEAYLQEALTIARELGLQERMCIILSNLGAGALPRGDIVRAEMYLQEGLTIARRIGHRDHIAHLLANLSALAEEQGNYTQAETFSQEGLAVAHELGNRRLISFSLLQLGVVAEKQDLYAQAEMYFHEALTLANELNILWLRSNIYQAWGEVYLKQRKLEDAFAAFAEAQKLVPEKNQYLQAEAYYGLARTSAAQGNILAARQQGEASLVLYERANPRKAAKVKHWLDTLCPS